MRNRSILGISIGILSILTILPTFAVEVKLPTDNRSNDIAINTNGNTSETEGRVLGIKYTSKTNNTTISGNENTLYSAINTANEYLWWSFGALAMGLTVYAGFQIITSGGDVKILKKSMRTFIGITIGLAIAMLSAVLIKIIINLI